MMVKDDYVTQAGIAELPLHMHTKNLHKIHIRHIVCKYLASGYDCGTQQVAPTQLPLHMYWPSSQWSGHMQISLIWREHQRLCKVLMSIICLRNAEPPSSIHTHSTRIPLFHMQVYVGASQAAAVLYGCLDEFLTDSKALKGRMDCHV
jgi:hypothetical protein